ncbi:helix-turn-helix transcriptional regulator [Pseudonocardia sp. ICBG601]|uniref:helix-turn-helix transcriptional regulator n=1 Tax=Pseudonocardia sp. ICBG601 TaxID=2846759 RepID=UPI001CF6DE87|nr:helix-turn-helix transcriptional regulator [Pseudonocardia sp. ICBG601]
MRELSARELALARAWGAPARLGRALRTAGELESGTAAVALLREAVEVLRQSSDRAEGRRAALALRRRTAGPVPVPPEDACGPSRLAGRPADRRHGLTPREYRTAELAAGGRTNPEIATALGTSVRGVEKHLTRIYRKLGVAGRPALGRMWEEGSDLHR